ncbi:hypothetical protein A0256_10480 [Mucilaginibacter sp. PAMC 26640]|nr:hypothetical protein A0256_10480 [Mucilaginibacter sp. PAMC 26640]
MSKPHKIALITSGQPSLNPRLVKEADTLAAAGYDVLVIYQFWNHWGTELDKPLLASKKWSAIRVGGTPEQNKATYWLSRIRHKSGQKFIDCLRIRSPFAEMAIGRCTHLLTNEALKHHADLYIAHNLAALPAAVLAAKKHQAKCGFDAEDFHRNEVTDDIKSIDLKLKQFIEDKYLPQADYLTTSSPAISAAYAAIYPVAPVTILNTFCSEKILTPANTHAGKLKLFWFSQTIAADRGIGDCIEALKQLNLPGIELHLLGHASEQVKKQLLALAGDSVVITFNSPIPSDHIISYASQFDIGLAMETSVPFNRNICLTNKIFTYIQAGLALIASDTLAQQQLLSEYQGLGKIYQNGNAAFLAEAISYYYHHPEELLKVRKNAIRVAREVLNWEEESQKYLALIKTKLAE